MKQLYFLLTILILVLVASCNNVGPKKKKIALDRLERFGFTPHQELEIIKSTYEYHNYVIICKTKNHEFSKWQLEKWEEQQIENIKALGYTVMKGTSQELNDEGELNKLETIYQLENRNAASNKFIDISSVYHLKKKEYSITIKFTG